MSTLPTSSNQNNFAPPKTSHVEVLGSSRWKLATPFMSHKDRVTEIALLKLIRSCLDNSLPIAESIRIFADETRWLTKSRIRSFASRLYHGYSLAQSMASCPNLFSPESIIAAQLDEQSGNVASHLTELIDQKCLELKTISRRFQMTYITWIFMLVLLSLFHFFIWPTLIKMLDEFSLTRPESLKFTDGILQRSIGSWFFSPILFLCMLFLFIYWLCDIPSFRKGTNSLLSWTMIKRQKVQSTVYRFVAEALRQNRPISTSLEALAQNCNNRNTQQKLRSINQQIAYGENPWVAMNQAGLITSQELSFLRRHETDPQYSHVTQAILFESKANVALSDIETRISKRALLLKVGLTLFFGAAVLLICYSLFDVLYLIVREVSFPDKFSESPFAPKNDTTMWS